MTARVSVVVLTALALLGVGWTHAPPAGAQERARVTDGLVALYTFEDNDNPLGDSAGTAEPLDLEIAEDSSAEVAEGALVISGSSLVASAQPATAMATACRESDEITIEAWLQPGSLDQTGPARIVTLSRDTSTRNFTLGQSGDRYIVRLRTTQTNPQGTPELEAPEGSLTAELTHVAFTRAADGTARIYVNGEAVAEGQRPGDLSNWADDLRFALGNELTRDRVWLGSIHLVAIYSRALSADEIRVNLEAGPDA